MAITASDVKMLREATGAGMMDCKKALEEAGGDHEAAVDVLRKRGVAKAAKKVARETAEGLVGSYVHSNGKIATLVELNCESDFVARNEEFQQLLKDLCMQVAAAKPQPLTPEDMPEDVVAREREIYRGEAEGKPDHVVDKIVEGKLRKFYADKCLLEQPFVKDNDIKINDLLTQKIAKLGENIRVSRFVRFQVGID